MNRIIPNRNQSIFKSKNEVQKKKISHSVQKRRNEKKTNKKIDDQSSIILKLLV